MNLRNNIYFLNKYFIKFWKLINYKISVKFKKFYTQIINGNK